jgi:crotonobetainyl-CoA:carnitine CoA-transferase CaiB-like acyl-CoA transferase
VVESSPLPLDGIRVIDAATIIAAPMIATYLGDFGADVLKIEHPEYGDRMRDLGHRKEGVPVWWKLVSRNKRSVTVNLGHPEGQSILKRLVAGADVLIENFRPGTMERWNLGWEVLHGLNPRLVMVRLTGFGQTGPYKDYPGFGTLAEAMSGFAAQTGFPDTPPTLPPYGLADSITALYGTVAVLLALYHRDLHDDHGQYIDLSILESMFHILGPHAVEYDQLGFVPRRLGNRVEFAAPRNLYQTADDRWVALSGSAQSIVARIFEAIGQPGLVHDERFRDNASRVAHAEELDCIIGDWIRMHTREEVLAHFREHEVAIAPVFNIADIFDDPHFKARGALIPVDDAELGAITMQGVLPRLADTPGQVTHAGPRKGEHTDEVLDELGISQAARDRLRQEKVI